MPAAGPQQHEGLHAVVKLSSQIPNVRADPTLIELAGLPTVPKCKGDPAADVHCLHGTSYASAFGVGTAQPRAAALHQWPYSTCKPRTFSRFCMRSESHE